MNKATQLVLPDRLFVFPLRDTVVFPGVPAQLSSSRQQTIQLVTQAVENNRPLALVVARTSNQEPRAGDLHRVGIVATVQRMWHLPDGSIRLIVQGHSRISISRYFPAAPFITARANLLIDKNPSTQKMKALASNVSHQFQELITTAPQLPDELQIAALNIEDPCHLADFVAFHLRLPISEKQELLAETSVFDRLERLSRLISQELEIFELGAQIQTQVQGELDKTRREYLLREQIRVLQQELGESDDRAQEIQSLRSRLQAASLPPEASKEADRELERLSRMSVAAAEYTSSRAYLDWIADLPWSRTSAETVNIPQAKKLLNRDHDGLESVKERILDFLAVRQLNPEIRGPVLCLVGPPGVGKTTLGQSIAEALGRPFARIALGGLRDEAELRGHRRTYVSAMPGRIIQCLQRVGTRNPVIMLDELDKLRSDFQGNPAAVLLEILDPEQNTAFLDHYLNIPFDLSRILFIGTANTSSEIPDALRDRLEILNLSGYTDAEKSEIARKHLLPRQLKAHGLTKRQVKLSKPVIHRIIVEYTLEAGLRNLEREIGTICRRVARNVVEGQHQSKPLTPEDLSAYLGPARFLQEIRNVTTEPGITTGLAATPVGGQTFTIEVTAMEGHQELTLTGHLGEIMKESALAALSYVRSHCSELGFEPQDIAKSDIHIHVPAAAVPKDGPSAGVALTVALASLFSGRPVRKDYALTGEITLRGRVLPVGSIKDKLLAAHRAGIRKVIIPAQNKRDLEEVPTAVRKKLSIHCVQTVAEAISLSLHTATRRADDRSS